MNQDAYFYLNLTDRIKNESTKARMYRINDKVKYNITQYFDGYVWIWQEPIRRWDSDNYSHERYFYKVSEKEKTVHNNSLWIDMTKPENQDLTDNELHLMACEIFMDYFKNNLESLNKKIDAVRNKIAGLDNIIEG